MRFQGSVGPFFFAAPALDQLQTQLSASQCSTQIYKIAGFGSRAGYCESAGKFPEDGDANRNRRKFRRVSACQLHPQSPGSPSHSFQESVEPRRRSAGWQSQCQEEKSRCSSHGYHVACGADKRRVAYQIRRMPIQQEMDTLEKRVTADHPFGSTGWCDYSGVVSDAQTQPTFSR